MLKDDILFELENNSSLYISGQKLAKRYGVSRNAVWKAVRSLKNEGYQIDSVTNRGYILRDDSDVLSNAGIKARLQGANVHIIVHEQLDSTNNEAKRMLASDCEMEHTLIVCDEQKKGRGRNGNSFESPAKGGIYMTFVYRLSKSVHNPERVNAVTADAVTEAVKELCEINLTIDRSGGIYYDAEKIGGILIEAVTGLESGYIGHVITGIGIIMSYLNISRNDLIAAITCKLMSEYENGEGFW